MKKKKSEGTSPTGGSGTGKFMLHLPEEFRAPLNELARRNFSNVTAEVRQMVAAKLRELGLLDAPSGGKGEAG